MNKTIVIFLPGTTGTSLIEGNDTSSRVWPDGVGAILAGTEGTYQDRGKLAADLLAESTLNPFLPVYWDTFTPGGANTNVMAYGLTREYFDGLGFATVAATGPENPNWGLPQAPDNGLVFVAFPYDWRLDLRTSATIAGAPEGNKNPAPVTEWNLQAFIQTVYSFYELSAQDSIVLVGHSMGGLVARTYLETIDSSDPGYSNISMLITLGTPHLGAPLTLDATSNPQDIGFLGASITNDFTVMAMLFANGKYGMSSYELLPPQGVTANFNGENPTNYVNASNGAVNPITDSAVGSYVVSTGGGESTENLEDAESLFSSLKYGNASGSLPPYKLVYGVFSDSDTQAPYGETLQSFNVEYDDDDTIKGFFANWVDGSGDHIVPLWSAQFCSRTDIPDSEMYEANGVEHGPLGWDPGVLCQVFKWATGSPDCGQ